MNFYARFAILNFNIPTQLCGVTLAPVDLCSHGTWDSLCLDSHFFRPPAFLRSSKPFFSWNCNVLFYFKCTFESKHFTFKYCITYICLFLFPIRLIYLGLKSINPLATILNDNFVHQMSSRRLSTESTMMSSQEKLKLPSSSLSANRKGSRKLKLSESVASSLGSNLNRAGGAQDLTRMLLTDDYFSDVNPRSMRRLMNVVYITGDY